MRLPAVFFCALLVTSVSAKGLRVAWEKVFLFLAYRIDQLEPDETKRTIGFKCEDMLFDTHGIGYCKENKYVPCQVNEYNVDEKAMKARNCIGIKEFLSHIDGQKWSRFPVDEGSTNAQRNKAPASLDFDLNVAARNLNNYGMDQNRYFAARVYKTPAGSPRDFNLMFEDIGKTVKNYITSTGTLDGHPEITKIREALEQVELARRVDHSKFLVQHLEAHLPGVTLAVPIVGTDVHGNNQIAFDPVQTVTDNVAAHPNIQADLKSTMDDYYTNDPIAKDHKVVMNSIETTRNQIGSISCGI